MSDVPKLTKPELPQLTSIRAIAAWWVVLFHGRAHLAPYLPRWCKAVFDHGAWGVDIFFILSGFVIYLNYHQRVKTSAQIRSFFWRRFARIWPLHALMLGLLAVYAFLAAARGAAPTSSLDPAYLPAHFALLQTWGLDPQLRWNVPSWSISAELAAYILFPAAVVLLRPQSWPVPLFIVAIGLSWGLLVSTFILLGSDDITATVGIRALLRCTCEFAMGAALCGLWFRTDALGALRPYGFGVLAIAIAGAYFGAPSSVFVPGASLGVVTLLAGGFTAAGWLTARAPVFLGDISYATYLVHYPLLIFVKALLGHKHGGALPLSTVVVWLVLVLVASIALYLRFERPAQRWLLKQGSTRSRAAFVG